MTTLFTLESELIDSHYQGTLDQQEMETMSQEIIRDTSEVTFEMEVIELIETNSEALPQMMDQEAIINDFTMECAIGGVGSRLAGIYSMEEDNLPSTVVRPAGSDSPSTNKVSSTWKEKAVALYEKLKAMIVGLFNKIKEFARRMWALLTDQVARMVKTLDDLRKLVKETDKQPEESRKRLKDEVLSEDPKTVNLEIHTAHTIFREFSEKIFEQTLQFTERFVGVLKEHKSDVKDGPNRIKNAKELTDKLSRLAPYLDFKDVAWLIKGTDAIDESTGTFLPMPGKRAVAHTDTIFGKWLGVIASSEVRTPMLHGPVEEWVPKYILPAFLPLQVKQQTEMMSVPDKDTLLTIIDSAKKMMQDFDRSLYQRLKKLINFQISFLAVVEQHYSTNNLTGDEDSQQAAKMIRVGVQLIGSLIGTTQSAVNIHTQASRLVCDYAITSFKHYK